MPTESENIQFLYLVLTHGGSTNLDYNAIAADLNLSNGATAKRWQRLRDAMDTGKNPGPSAYEFLWLGVKHSARDKAPNWKEIADLCGTTAGAASKRYSRMKKAFDEGVPAPGSASKPKNSAAATAATAATAAASQTKTPPVVTPKRKRGAAGGDASTPNTKKKTPKAAAVDEEKYKPSPGAADSDLEEQYTPTKKAKRTTPRPKAIPRPKSKSKDTVAIKQEQDQDQHLTLQPTAVLGIPPPQFQAIHHNKSSGNTNGDPLSPPATDETSDEYHTANEFSSEAEKQTSKERMDEWLEQVEV